MSSSVTSTSSASTTVTPIEPALEVSCPDELPWSDTADVVVVGWGCAGACAAIEARTQGASVLVIDRFSGGGASALSGGVVYAGGGTRYQQQAGFQDSPQAMQDYLQHEVQGVVSDATLARFTSQSVQNLEWLEQQGVRFDSTMPAYKTSYPPDGAYLYYSGNEIVPAYASAQHGHTPAPRGHRVVAKGQSGATLFDALRQSTLAHGARTLTQASVRRLVRDRATRRILGVEVCALPQDHPRTARHKQLDGLIAKWRLYQPAKAQQAREESADIEQAIGQRRWIRASRAVILTTGGYIFNPQMLQTHAPSYQHGLPIGGAGCDGSGIRLGQSVGAAAQGLGNISGWRFITPPAVWPKGLVINAQGQRFCNEQVYGATLGHALVEKQAGKAWLIVDSQLRWQAVRQCIFGKLWAFQALPALALMLLRAIKAPSITALASKLQIDPHVLQAQVEHANAAAYGECDDPMGKSADMRHALRQGPFFAIDISVSQSLMPLAMISLGGLRVQEDTGAVLNQQGLPIPCLFAAGRTAIGVASSRYVSGLSLADCIFSGRQAGRMAALSPLDVQTTRPSQAEMSTL